VNVADNFIRVDLTPRNTMKIGNGVRRNLQTFKLLLRDRVGDRPHVSLNGLLAKRGHGLLP
jgi:hypothetical protein